MSAIAVRLGSQQTRGVNRGSRSLRFTRAMLHFYVAILVAIFLKRNHDPSARAVRLQAAVRVGGLLGRIGRGDAQRELAGIDKLP